MVNINIKISTMEFSEPIRNIDQPEADQEADNLIHIDYLNVKKASLILRSLNNKLRQQILKFIDEEKRTTVTKIYVRLRLEQSVASQQLGILRKAGVVLTQREGKFIYYTINEKRITTIERFAGDIIG